MSIGLSLLPGFDIILARSIFARSGFSIGIVVKVDSDPHNFVLYVLLCSDGNIV